jgi:hypothetical protein
MREKDMDGRAGVVKLRRVESGKKQRRRENELAGKKQKGNLVLLSVAFTFPDRAELGEVRLRG